MYLLQTPTSFDPKINLATEEFIVRQLDADEDILFIYRNNPSVIIGKNQNPFEEINLKFLETENIEMYRRISGGGAVYHDPGNINFSYFTRNTGENFNNYKNFLQPVIKLLNRKGIPAQINKRNDIVINNLKISGNAQFSTRGKMFSHGTLLFNSDLDKINRVLKVKNNAIESKSTKSIRSQITNISAFLTESLDINIFLQELVQFIMDSFSFSGHIKPFSKQWHEIEKLALEKYDSWQWNWGRIPKFVKKVLNPLSNEIIPLEIENCIINSKDLNPVDSFIKLLYSLNGIRYHRDDILSVIDTFKEFNGKNKATTLERIISI